MTYYRLCAAPGCTANMKSNREDTCGACKQKAQRLTVSVTAAPFAPDWPDAACRGKEAIFFEPDRQEPREEREYRERTAIAMCEACPNAAACLTGALERREGWGIWGGVPARRFPSLRRASA